jgi:glyoxylase-like metal-dependent hydrolase (beta-lactamase superfamily II)
LALGQRKVSDSVTVFEGRHPMGLGVTATVVHSGGEAFVFDTLYYPADTKELLRSVQKMDLSVVGLINTHWHSDHTAGNQLFLQTQRVISHSLCGDLMRKDDTYDVGSDLNKDLKSGDKVRPRYPNESIADGSVLEVGRLEVKFLHTPGHTPDSITGWLKEESVMIAGDTVMQLPFIWYGDDRTLVESLQEVQKVLRGGKVVQGHGGTCTREKLDNDIVYLQNLRSLVTERFDSGNTIEEIKSRIRMKDCVPGGWLKSVPRLYEDVHTSNVERTYNGLEQSANVRGVIKSKRS